MKKIYTMIFILMTATILWAAYPSGSDDCIPYSNLGWDDALKWWRPIAVDGNGQVKMTGSMPAVEVDTGKIESYLVIPAHDDVATITAIQSSEAIGERLHSIEDNLLIPSTEDVATITIIQSSESLKERLNSVISEIATLSIDVLIASTTTDEKSIANRIDKSLGKTDERYPSSIVDTIASSTDYLIDEMKDGLTMDTMTILAEGASSEVPYTVGLTDSMFKMAVTEDSPVTDLTKRCFIEIRSANPEAEFKIAFRQDGDYRTVKGRILLECNNATVWIKVESSATLYVTEGWK